VQAFARRVQPMAREGARAMQGVHAEAEARPGAVCRWPPGASCKGERAATFQGVDRSVALVAADTKKPAFAGLIC